MYKNIVDPGFKIRDSERQNHEETTHDVETHVFWETILLAHNLELKWKKI